jgi:hypothetical protein
VSLSSNLSAKRAGRKRSEIASLTPVYSSPMPLLLQIFLQAGVGRLRMAQCHEGKIHDCALPVGNFLLDPGQLVNTRYLPL